MGEWFEKAFGDDYLKLYAHRDAAEAEQVVDLVVKSTGIQPGAIVLDAPCGAGRHLSVFQARGYQAFGFDLSMPLLRAAGDRGVRSGTIARTDIRALPLKSAQGDLVVNLFSSLGYFTEDEQNLRVITDLASLCKPAGWIVIDFMHSAHVRSTLRAASERVTSGGIKVTDRRWITEGRPRINKETTVLHPDGREDFFQESVRLFDPHELRSTLEKSGVMIMQEFGNYSGQAFDANAERIILVGRKR